MRNIEEMAIFARYHLERHGEIRLSYPSEYELAMYRELERRGILREVDREEEDWDENELEIKSITYYPAD